MRVHSWTLRAMTMRPWGIQASSTNGLMGSMQALANSRGRVVIIVMVTRRRVVVVVVHRLVGVVVLLLPEEHEQHDGAKHNHGQDEPAQVSVDGEVNHLLHRVKIGVIEVSQKPQDSRPQHLIKEKKRKRPGHNVVKTEGYMTEDERHRQQYVAHNGCDQALKVRGLDLKNSAKL
ncbi:hypothetical protein EYF80_000915 [Liparis tanakae]|uniref:Uncharacterized protein n=1 Tax=Liparis tanakae TaxID=230148 RepID=A0A4Z2JFL7_9TELE|nr:hypothetical protein EYF80_000915 [Liparis tanakae]